MTRALGYQLTEEVKKVGFSLIDILAIPISKAQAQFAHMKTPLAPPTQSVCEPGV